MKKITILSVIIIVLAIGGLLLQLPIPYVAANACVLTADPREELSTCLQFVWYSFALDVVFWTAVVMGARALYKRKHRLLVKEGTTQ